ncbi:hypothetical protein GGP51_003024 [Salinibacter ruber]|nr:hypothetical protein [Salinibacter ruber]
MNKRTDRKASWTMCKEHRNATACIGNEYESLPAEQGNRKRAI